METNSPISELLSRLTGLRRTRPDRWIAICPAHDDKSPSLSISETGDGTVLIRCWAGCGAKDIVGAVGLSLRDLFPKRLSFTKPYPSRKSFSAHEVVETACSEAMILYLAYQQILSGTPLTTQDAKRAAQAIRAITAIHSEVIR